MLPSSGSSLTAHERGAVAQRLEAPGQRDRLYRRPADVQPGDDPDDAHGFANGGARASLNVNRQRTGPTAARPPCHATTRPTAIPGGRQRRCRAPESRPNRAKTATGKDRQGLGRPISDDRQQTERRLGRRQVPPRPRVVSAGGQQPMGEMVAAAGDERDTTSGARHRHQRRVEDHDARPSGRRRAPACPTRQVTPVAIASAAMRNPIGMLPPSPRKMRPARRDSRAGSPRTTCRARTPSRRP